MKLDTLFFLILLLLLLTSAGADQPNNSTVATDLTTTSLHQQLQDVLIKVELSDTMRKTPDSLIHLRLVPTQSGHGLIEAQSTENGQPVMDRFYFYAYQYAANANLVAVQIPELRNLQTPVHQQIRRMNEPQMQSLLKSALGRAAGEFAMDKAFNRSTQDWVQAPSVTAEGFRQRLRPGMRFNVRGSLQGVGAGVRYNVAGLSISTAYSTRNQGVEPIRIARPFSSDWYRGEFGVDTRGNLWLNFVGRW